jgi:HlyD family secretion protein
VVCLLLAAIFAASPTFGQPPERPPASVVVSPVVEDVVGADMSFIGDVEPDRAVTVQAEVAGHVVRAEVREGEPVVEGETVLVTLDRRPKELALEEARALAIKARREWDKLVRGYRLEDIAEARQAVARAEARLRDLLAGARPEERQQARSALAEAEARRVWAGQELKRMTDLFAKGLVAAQERDRAWQLHEVARSQERAAGEQVGLLDAGTRPEQVEAARAELGQAKARLALLEAGPRSEEIAQAEAEYRRATIAVERLEDERRRMTILAPITGFVIRKRAEVGAWVRPGDPVADLIDLEPVYVVGPVSEREVGFLRPGARAQVTVDAYPGRTFDGEVAQIVPQADPQSRAFPVKVRVENPQHLLKSGMFARVRVEIGGGGRAVFVPKDALVRRAAGAEVFVVEDNVAHARPVRTGRTVGNLVEIMDGALARGQEVVVVGNEALRDGARVHTGSPGRQQSDRSR